MKVTQKKAFEEFGKVALLLLNEGAIDNEELLNLAKKLKLPTQTIFNFEEEIEDGKLS